MHAVGQVFAAQQLTVAHVNMFIVLSRSDAKVQAVDRGDSYQWQGPSTWACYRQVSLPARPEAHLNTCALSELSVSIYILFLQDARKAASSQLCAMTVNSMLTSADTFLASCAGQTRTSWCRYSRPTAAAA